jgi:hypothetical protein
MVVVVVVEVVGVVVDRVVVSFRRVSFRLASLQKRRPRLGDDERARFLALSEPGRDLREPRVAHHADAVHGAGAVPHADAGEEAGRRGRRRGSVRFAARVRFAGRRRRRARERWAARAAERRKALFADAAGASGHATRDSRLPPRGQARREGHLGTRDAIARLGLRPRRALPRRDARSESALLAFDGDFDGEKAKSRSAQRAFSKFFALGTFAVMPSTKGGPNRTKDNAVRVAKRKATKKEQSANQNKKHRELQLELAKQLGLKGPVTFNSVAAHFAALAHLDSDRAAVRGGMSDAFRADVQFVEEWVKHELRQMDGSHDWWHIHRVRNTALAIARKERPDGDDPAFDVVVELAALVHDVRDWKYSGDPEAGTRAIARDVAGMIRTITDVYPDVLRRVLNVVQRVGFKDELATSGECLGGVVTVRKKTSRKRNQSMICLSSSRSCRTPTGWTRSAPSASRARSATEARKDTPCTFQA